MVELAGQVLGKLEAMSDAEFAEAALGYFSRGGEIGHDNRGLLRVPLSAFHSGNTMLEDSRFSDFTLACLGRGFLNISFID